jgi:hypothetical protein
LNTALTPFLFQEELYQIPAKTLVVMKKPWDAYTSEEKLLLSKILGSVKLTLASVQLIVQPTLILSSLRQGEKVLVFGSESQGSPYVCERAQGFTILKADDLSELDDAKKKSLWLALKEMFTI